MVVNLKLDQSNKVRNSGIVLYTITFKRLWIDVSIRNECGRNMERVNFCRRPHHIH